VRLSERLSVELVHANKAGDTDLASLLREAAALARRVEDAPVATMDKREFLSLCAPTWEDFPALYALQGKRVRLVPEAGQGGGE